MVLLHCRVASASLLIPYDVRTDSPLRFSLRAILGWMTVAAVLLAISVQWRAIGFFLVSFVPIMVYHQHVRNRFVQRGLASFLICSACLLPIYISSAGPFETLRRFVFHRGSGASHDQMLSIRDAVFWPTYPVEYGGFFDLPETIGMQYALYLAEWDGYGYHLFRVTDSDET